MKNRWLPVAFRLVVAALAVGAMVFQLFAVHLPKGYGLFNFFTYFTNLSNILISIVFIVTAVRLIATRRAPTETDTAIRGGVVVYIAFVGLVFNTRLFAVRGEWFCWVGVHAALRAALLRRIRPR